jgi:hypothetical protein
MGMLFPKTFSGKTPRSQLLSLSLRGFGGGLNSVDDDFTMEPKYAMTLKNFRRTPSGGQQVRFGSNWFADVKGFAAGNIMDMCYFNGRIVVVMDSGEIATVTPTGVVAVGWNSGVANALPGHPSGWKSTYVAVSFVPFKDTLIIHNGVDKPIVIDKNYKFDYLQDLAVGSNVNTPIGKYGCVAQNYHCIAGVVNLPTTIYISAVGTSGVFPGDAAPNDSISIDVGAYSPEGAVAIRGLAGFRSYLIVFFQGQSLLVQLGNYDSNGIHKPQFPDTLPKFGLLGQRCVTPVEHDLIFSGLDGFSDAKKNLFSGVITSDHVSDRIEPFYRNITGNLTDSQQQNNCFMVHDPLWHDTILFNPSGRCFVHTGSENLHYSSWSEYNFPKAWTCACVTFLGRIFYALGTRIYQHGNPVFIGENYYADCMNDRDANWAVNTIYGAGQIIRDTLGNVSYTCMVAHTSGTSNIAADIAANPTWWLKYTGIPIAFEMELPWLSGKDPMKSKHLRFISIGTLGSAEFTAEAYVDGMYKDDNGVVRFGPGLSVPFTGGGTLGAGYNDGPMGGGRRADDPRLWGYPLKFKLLKLRFIGTTTKPLQIISASFLYSRGKYKR